MRWGSERSGAMFLLGEDSDFVPLSSLLEIEWGDLKWWNKWNSDQSRELHTFQDYLSRRENGVRSAFPKVWTAQSYFCFGGDFRNGEVKNRCSREGSMWRSWKTEGVREGKQEVCDNLHQIHCFYSCFFFFYYLINLLAKLCFQ